MHSYCLYFTSTARIAKALFTHHFHQYIFIEQSSSVLTVYITKKGVVTQTQWKLVGTLCTWEILLWLFTKSGILEVTVQFLEVPYSRKHHL